MSDYYEAFMDMVRDFRHNYKRFQVYGLAEAGTKARTQLRKIRAITYNIDMDLRKSEHLSYDAVLKEELDKLLNIETKKPKKLKELKEKAGS